MADQTRFTSFKNFWPYYLSEHDNPMTRTVHALGTAVGAVATVFAAVTVTPWLIPVGVAGIYGVLTASHLAFQGNIPATFQKGSLKNVLWSMAGDMKMVGMWFTGGLRKEYTRLGINPDGRKRAKEKPVVKAPELKPSLGASAQDEFKKAAEPKNDAAPGVTPPGPTPPAL